MGRSEPATLKERDMKQAIYLAALMVALTASNAFAGAAVPEIDGGSVATGLGLLSGAVMIVRSRMQRR
jgi:hypothetical protein